MCVMHNYASISLNSVAIVQCECSVNVMTLVMITSITDNTKVEESNKCSINICTIIPFLSHTITRGVELSGDCCCCGTHIVAATYHSCTLTVATVAVTVAIKLLSQVHTHILITPHCERELFSPPNANGCVHCMLS